MKQLIDEAALQVGRPTFFSMLIIIIAHIPIFTLQRHEGRIFAPMAYTVVSALIGSLLFSLTLVPLLCYAFMRRGVTEKENFLRPRVEAAVPPAAGGGAARGRVRGDRHGRRRAGRRAWRSCRGWAASSCPSSTREPSGST